MHILFLNDKYECAVANCRKFWSKELNWYGITVVYICTEGVFPSKRFSQLVESRTEENRSSDLGDFGERLLLRHEASIDSLVQCISNRFVKCLSQNAEKFSNWTIRKQHFLNDKCKSIVQK